MKGQKSEFLLLRTARVISVFLVVQCFVLSSADEGAGSDSSFRAFNYISKLKKLGAAVTVDGNECGVRRCGEW